MKRIKLQECKNQMNKISLGEENYRNGMSKFFKRFYENYDYLRNILNRERIESR